MTMTETPARPKPETTWTFSSCAALPGFTFTMPIFPGWGTRSALEPLPHIPGCRVLLHSGSAKFETARAIVAIKAEWANPRHWFNAEGVFWVGTARCFNNQTNSAGVRWGFAFDPAGWVLDYEPAPGQWDYVHVYGAQYTARILIDGGDIEHGFDRDAVAHAIGESARFT